MCAFHSKKSKCTIKKRKHTSLYFRLLCVWPPASLNSRYIMSITYSAKEIVLFVVVDIIQYIPRNMHTVFALLCFVVVMHWLIFPYPSGLLHWHCGNLTIAPMPAKQPWWIWINTSCEFIMNDCITTTKQSTTKPCAYFLGYTVVSLRFYMKGISNDWTVTIWTHTKHENELGPNTGCIFVIWECN